MSTTARTSTRARATFEPSASRVGPVIGAVRSFATSASSRPAAPPPNGAHPGWRTHTRSIACRAISPEDAYQGSRSRTGYAESRTTECSRSWWRDMNDCANQVP